MVCGHQIGQADFLQVLKFLPKAPDTPCSVPARGRNCCNFMSIIVNWIKFELKIYSIISCNQSLATWKFCLFPIFYLQFYLFYNNWKGSYRKLSKNILTGIEWGVSASLLGGETGVLGESLTCSAWRLHTSSSTDGRNRTWLGSQRINHLASQRSSGRQIKKYAPHVPTSQQIYDLQCKIVKSNMTHCQGSRQQSYMFKFITNVFLKLDQVLQHRDR